MRFSKGFVTILAIALIVALALPAIQPTQAQGESLLAKVKARGKLICGINGTLAGFGRVESDGKITGFDADFCRAIALAIFGDAAKLEMPQVAAADRFPKIQAGEIDVLVRNTTISQERDTKQGADFGPVLYYDGQTFLTRKADNLSKVEDLKGTSICVIKGTTTEQNLADIISSFGIDAKSVPFDNLDQVFEAFNAQRCQAVTSDRSQLSARLATSAEGKDWVLFSDNFSREPLAPAYKAGDAQWGDLVRWVVYATVIAEEHGVTSQNIDAKMADATLNPEAKRLFDVEGEFYKNLGLDKGWAVNIIKNLGNYGEIYERNLGVLGIARGPNALWRNGGLVYAPPYR